MQELIWKRRKDGSLIARTPKSVYEIRFRYEPKMRLYKLCDVVKNGKVYYTIDVMVKDRVLFESDSEWEQQQQTNQKKLKEAITEAKSIASRIYQAKGIPKKTLPYPKEVYEAATARQKLFNRMRKQYNVYKSSLIAQEATNQNVKVKTMKYTGPAPAYLDRRSAKEAITIPSGRNPLPYKPKNLKFKGLYKWGEKVRNFYWKQGKFVTAEYLTYAAQYMFGLKTFDESSRVAKKVALIYADLVKQDRAIFNATVDLRPPEVREAELQANKVEKVKQQKEKKEKIPLDKWGTRIGTKAAAINAAITKIPKSIKRIAFEADATEVQTNLHLKKLVERKLVKKIGENFRLRKPKKTRELPTKKEKIKKS